MKIEVEMRLTPEQLAAAFCDLDDDSGAKFFVACAEIATKTFELRNYGQWWEVGKHLRTCACATEEARDMVSAITSAGAGEGHEALLADPDDRRFMCSELSQYYYDTVD
jgi:hypothetical protein